MRMKPLISIVIPTHNAEPYLSSCMATISRQGVAADALELIFVDDGSTDGSAGQLDALAAQDPRVTVIHQENRGAGAARNAGMRMARGTYTYFFDADDSLEDGALSTLLGQCLERELDVLFFGATLVYESAEAERKSPQDPHYFERRQAPGVMSGEAMFIEQQKTGNYCGQPCMLITRTEFLREANVRFAEGIINEDNLFVLLATIRAQRADVDPHPYYRYLVREGSVTVSNTQGFKRLDAHLWLTHAFELEYFRAELAGKHELAHAISKLIGYFVEVALEAYLGIEGEMPELTTTDPLLLRMVRDQFERIRRDEHALAAQAAELEALRARAAEADALKARLAEVEASTSWKAGRAVTAPLRAAKDALAKKKHP